MIKNTFIFISLLISFQLQGQVFKNNELTISQLEENMWVVETNDMTTMYIIEGKQNSMLIDTGTDAEKLDSIVKLITDKPLLVMITHMHPDHAGNIKYFDEIYMHEADTVLIAKMGVNYSGKINYVVDGQKFDLGGTVIEVVHAPGHTPGSIVLLDRKNGYCYSGDAFGSGQVWMQLEPHVSMKIYVESCRKMEKLMNEGISKIYCGHYPHIKKALGKNYITDMRQLAEALSKGNAPEGQAYEVRLNIGAQNPMITTKGSASIVYDPDNIN